MYDSVQSQRSKADTDAMVKVRTKSASSVEVNKEINMLIITNDNANIVK